MGTPTSAPPAETAYFRSIGLDCKTITRRDDSRACARIARAASLPLAGLQAGDSVQFAVAADQWLPESSVRLTVGGHTTRHESLRPARWLDIRLDAPAGARTLEIETDEPLWVSYPRVVRQRAASSQEKAGTPRHIVVIVLDGLSRRLHAVRHPTDPARAVTPNLDRFFEGGLDLPFGFSSSEWTLPAAATFFTGLYPSRHRMVHPSHPVVFSAGRKLLAEHFQEAGYHTLALSAGNRFTPVFGSHRGFDRFIYHWPYEGQYTALAYDPAVWVQEMLGHLDLHRNDATFTYAHFPDTHPAWNVPPFTRSFSLGRRGDSTGHGLDRLERSPLGREQGEQLLLLRLYEFDRTIDALLRYIDRELPSNTLVVLTADHGTPWPGAHDAWSDTVPYLNEFRTATFLKMKGCGVPAGRRSELVSPNLDLMPTLLAAAGLPSPLDLEGRNLLDASSPRSHLISETFLRRIYEIAVSDTRRQWIERHPIDERSLRITGPAVFRGGFPAGCTDYTKPVHSTDPEFEAIAAAHIRGLGELVKPGSSGPETARP